jgi:hypothetical protein
MPVPATHPQIQLPQHVCKYKPSTGIRHLQQNSDEKLHLFSTAGRTCQIQATESVALAPNASNRYMQASHKEQLAGQLNRNHTLTTAASSSPINTATSILPQFMPKGSASSHCLILAWHCAAKPCKHTSAALECGKGKTNGA